MSNGLHTPGSQVTAEMAEQPEVLARLVGRRDQVHADVRAVLPERLRGICLIARGSSDNVAVHARYLLELATGMAVSMVAPSLITRYRRVPDLRDHLVIALSQSGRTPEIVDVATQSVAAGGIVVAVTNDADSPLATVSAVTLAVGTSEELAVPATKTVTGQLALVTLLAEATCPAGTDIDHFTGGSSAWAALAQSVCDTLVDTDPLRSAVDILAARRDGIHLARGLTYAAALEGALKAKETTRRGNEGYSSADFLHGPITVASPDVAVVAYGADGPVLTDVVDTVRAAVELGSPVIGVGHPAVADGIDGAVWVPTPQNLGEALSVIPMVVRGQQLAVDTTLALGMNPDAPHGLNKVTATH
jgi:glucosamine--fructose-6-phosphate aminotransferase (isomerizing)